MFIVKKHPKLKSRYKTRVEASIEYVKTIDDFDNLVDPRTLARHCLGPEPSSFVLRAIEIKEKSESSFFSFLFFLVVEMTTKFNQEMYAKIKARKNEPLEAWGRRLCRWSRRELRSPLLPPSPRLKGLLR